jgi:hypothetical protein
MIIKCPNCESELELEITPKNKDKTKDNAIKLIRFYKVIIGIPEDDKQWDKVYVPMYIRTAYQLLDLFTFNESLDCVEFVINDMKQKNLGYNFQTCVKCANIFREKLSKKT